MYTIVKCSYLVVGTGYFTILDVADGPETDTNRILCRCTCRETKTAAFVAADDDAKK